jgi:hypothetical protein
MTVSPRDAVDAAQAAFGRHPGFRALDAKGILCTGTFTATAEARSLTTAAHLHGEPVRATFRFSNASGNPRSPDFAPEPAGAGGRALSGGTARGKTWSASRPRCLPRVLRALHTDRGDVQEPYIGWRAARRRGRDYLREELREQSAAGPVRLTLEGQIGGPGDPVDDPSREWPAWRRRVTVGTFEITGPEMEREQGRDVLVFDPTRVTPGIELSDDPVRRFRSPAYRESVGRRTAGS